jgi:hypothetical protein
VALARASVSAALPALLRQVAALGHAVFTAELSLNLVGQRSPSRRAGELDDLLSAVWFEAGRWNELAWPCSVDPGRHFLASPVNAKGTAIIAPGQYRGAYALGLHRGRPALVQVGPVTVHRDGDRDDVLEPGGAGETGLFAINIHDDAGAGAEASAGCTVLPRAHEAELLALVERAVPHQGPTLTYTVLELQPA